MFPQASDRRQGGTDYKTQLASLASEELDKGDFLMATKILTTSIRLEPNNHDLYFDRSICHHKLGNFQASLDDVNTAINLNPNDYYLHYHKGLALIGLTMFSDAVSSFKKAIELRAKQEDSKLSDIFKLLRDATNDLNTARLKAGLSNHQNRSDATAANTAPIVAQDNSAEPVDSTTDRLSARAGGSSSSHQVAVNSDSPMKVEGVTNVNNLVVTNRNNIRITPNPSQALNGTVLTGGVSSTASHANNQVSPIIISTERSGANLAASPFPSGSISINPLDQHMDPTKVAQYEWNIRRSERIFLHSGDSTLPGPQYGIIMGPAGHQLPINATPKPSSNPSSINSGKATKRPNESTEPPQSYQQNKLAKSKDGANSHQESDVDVDDSFTNNHNQHVPSNAEIIPEPMGDRKRVMIAPSSSMPATSQVPVAAGTGVSKEDSYSSKYKRLRRDRERARRGTSKLCTIKYSDLEELQRPSNTGKRFMRVIAPIDGWLYSGELSIDDSSSSEGLQYTVKLDGDTTGSSYLFSHETVLNDVIKEVRVKSVSELRKGARICCYWSRQYKCLSTGVVTSRTFEATKSLVSVKYDNGDLSALPLEDLRLLPPDYPKYMSNCDPLLLARNTDGAQLAATNTTETMNQHSNNHVVVENKQVAQPVVQEEPEVLQQPMHDSHSPTPKIAPVVEPTKPVFESSDDDDSSDPLSGRLTIVETEQNVEEDSDELSVEETQQTKFIDDRDTSIPPTTETIDFITGDSNLGHNDDEDDEQDEEERREISECVERVTATQDEITITNETQLNVNNNSRASSEENNYGIEYRPWIFEGLPKRNRRHGRTYRDIYQSIRRGNEVIRVGDSAELMPRDESILPFIAKIEGFWATSRGEMRVRVRWYYRLVETEGQPYELKDGENALFMTEHFDENDVQSIYRSTRIVSWTEYERDHMGHINKIGESSPKVFYLAGDYDPVRRIKQLRSDVKEAQ